MSALLPLLFAGLLLPLASASAAPLPGRSSVTLANLRTEYKTDPLGIDARLPRFSWELRSGERGVVQTAYEIRVKDETPGSKDRGKTVWNTGKVESDASMQNAYAGQNLQPGHRYVWQVRVWDGEGEATAWSEPASFEMGLLEPSDWQAEWITSAWDEDTTKSVPPAMLRSTFNVDGRIASARAYVTALGLYEARLNGEKIGDEVLTPGWTSYHHQLQYQTYDVTDQLKQGKNAVGATLGDGWYRGWLAWDNNRNTWGNRTALLLQIHITYADGREQIVGTDETWKASTGPIQMSDIYMGEIYDARLEKTGWTTAGYDDGNWEGVHLYQPDADMLLVAPAGPPIRRIQKIAPVKIIHTPAGETVFDMGQNMVGWVRLNVQGPAGTTVTLRHAEVLDRDGNFYTDNLRKAKQEIQYTLKGGGPEVFEPHFTFQGFRYVAVEGYPGEPTLDDLTGIVVHSDMLPTGTFETSNTLLNQLQHNIVWGQKGNFVGVPTDCPQRDERLGWTGDAQVFSRTAAFNMDVAGFFTKWLRDVAYDQRADGSVPFVVPNALGPNAAGSSAWADVSTIIPWNMYLAYGDRRLLEAQYPSMKKWVEYMRAQAGDSYLWRTGFHFGDWLAYATTRSDYPGATTDKDLIASAFFAHSTDLVQKAAEVLGKTQDAREYADLLEHIKQAFLKEYVTPNGRMASNTQTAYAVALMFGLLPEDMRTGAAERLAEDVHRFDNHLTTGFVGTPYLTHVLSNTGHLDVAYALLNQDTYPSWLYPVKMGATTIWERWDGIKPDGSFQDPGMNSFNHYAYGAIGDWMYRVVAGLDTDSDEPGYKHVLIQPEPGGGLTYASADLHTMYGEAASGWKFDNGRLVVNATVPPNAHGTVRLPGAALAQVTESGKPLSEAPGVTASRQDGPDVVVEIGSGHYVFTYPAAVQSANAAK